MSNIEFGEKIKGQDVLLDSEQTRGVRGAINMLYRMLNPGFTLCNDAVLICPKGRELGQRGGESTKEAGQRRS